MAWKDWTYAKKGAVIVFILPVIVFFIELLNGLFFDPSSPWGGFATIVLFLLSCLLSPVGYFIGKLFDKKQKEDFAKF